MAGTSIVPCQELIERLPDDISPENEKNLRALDKLLARDGFKEPSVLIRHPWFRTQPEFQHRLKDIVNVCWNVEQKHGSNGSSHPLSIQINHQASAFVADCLVAFSRESGLKLTRLANEKLTRQGWRRESLSRLSEGIPPRIFSRLSQLITISSEIGADIDGAYDYMLLHEPRGRDPILYVTDDLSANIEIGRWT